MYCLMKRFRILDLGGQKTERRKWLHCFENVDAVLFVSALNEYYEILLNDGCKVRINFEFKFYVVSSVQYKSFSFCSTLMDFT